MANITKEKALEIITSLFEFTKWEDKTDAPFNFFSEKDDVYTFYIDKRLVMRDEVIMRLYESFKTSNIEGCQVRVEPITLVYTVFHLEPRNMA